MDIGDVLRPGPPCPVHHRDRHRRDRRFLGDGEFTGEGRSGRDITGCHVVDGDRGDTALAGNGTGGHLSTQNTCQNKGQDDRQRPNRHAEVPDRRHGHHIIQLERQLHPSMRWPAS